jgi:ribonuclease HI
VNSPDLRPLWEEAKRRAARLERFEIQHVLRGKNKRADALDNQAMDRGSGRTVRELAGKRGGDDGPDAGSGMVTLPRIAAGADRPTKPADRSRTLKGFVKNGVVHLLEGELPENCFVRVTVE